MIYNSFGFDLVQDTKYVLVVGGTKKCTFGLIFSEFNETKPTFVSKEWYI
jgi:hypothetical protein